MSGVPVSLEAIEVAREAEVNEALQLHQEGQIKSGPADALKSAFKALASVEALSDEQFTAHCISYGGLRARLRGLTLDMRTENMTSAERRVWRASLAGKGHPSAPAVMNNVEWRIAVPLLQQPFTEAELPHVFSQE